jgi:response regulator RpfG family c-di-GMP phosphodiesterase
MTKPTILVVTTDKDLLRTFYTVAIKLDMKLLPLAEVSSRDFLAQPWHAVIVDSATPNIDGISLLSLVRSLSPLALRGLVVSSPDHQLLLRAVNEAQVHHIWVKPLSAKEIMDALQQQTEIAGGRTLPLAFGYCF